MGNWAFWSGHKQSRTISGYIEPVILIFLLVSSTDGFTQELFQVPARNTLLIAFVRPGILDDASLIRHLHYTDSLVEANMEEEDMQLAVAVMQQFQPTDSITLSDVANGLWISASHAPALFLMGKACLADQDPDNLNNYAAFLEMAGRPDLAIPILNRLNKEYPNHSTVLNNIGQAWFRLGDIAKAEKYLDSAIILYPNHSQANLTQAIIANSKGNKTKTIDCLKKSINEAYSPEKQQMLDKLGYTITKKDIRRRMHMPEDPLGFDYWLSILPPWPKESFQAMEVLPAWDLFFKKVTEEEASLRAEIRQKQKVLMQQLSTSAKGQIALHRNDSPFNLSPKEQIILKLYQEDDDKSGVRESDYYKYTGEWWTDQITAILSVLAEKRQQIKDKPGDDIEKCPQIATAHNIAIGGMADISQKYFWAVMNFKKHDIAAKAYMALNTEKNPLTADLTMINARVEFLDIFTTILRPTIATKANLPPDVCMVKTEQEPAGKLSVWEDTHSPEVAFVMPFIGRWFIKGNTAGLDLDPLMLPFDFHYRENLNNQSAISCSGSIKINKVKAGGEYNFVKETAKVEVGVSPKTDWLKDTPIKTGVQGSAFIEIGKDGISDFGVEGKLGVKPDQGKSTEVAGMTIEPRIGKIELSTKVSWNAGATGNLKGQLHQSFFNYGN